MRSRHLEVVQLNRNLVENGLNEGLPSRSASPVSQFDANEQLGHRYRRYHDVIVVAGQSFEVPVTSFCRNQDSRVEDQSFQRDASSVSAPRIRSRSSDHVLSLECLLSISLIVLPVAPEAGAMRATGWPFLITTNV